MARERSRARVEHQVYTRRFPAIYDAVILGFYLRRVWRCPRGRRPVAVNEFLLPAREELAHAVTLDRHRGRPLAALDLLTRDGAQGRPVDHLPARPLALGDEHIDHIGRFRGWAGDEDPQHGALAVLDQRSAVINHLVEQFGVVGLYQAEGLVGQDAFLPVAAGQQCGGGDEGRNDQRPRVAVEWPAGSTARCYGRHRRASARHATHAESPRRATWRCAGCWSSPGNQNQRCWADPRPGWFARLVGRRSTRPPKHRYPCALRLAQPIPDPLASPTEPIHRRNCLKIPSWLRRRALPDQILAT
jgi:hypothetical protein